MHYQSYKEIACLDANVQREILHCGDGVERIWAAWALGLNLGATSQAALVNGLNESPEPGTRRHLLVILAGFGEQEILRTFAQHDPDDFVRLTAYQYLARICRSTDSETQQFLREQLIGDSSRDIKEAILAESQPESLALSFEDLINLRNNTDTRAYATQHLIVRASQNKAFFRNLEDHILQVDSNNYIRMLGVYLEACIAQLSDSEFIEIIQSLPDEYRYHALQLIVSKNISIPTDRFIAAIQSLSNKNKLMILNWLACQDKKYSFNELTPISELYNSELNACLAVLLNSSEAIQGWQWLVERIAYVATSHQFSVDDLYHSPCQKEEDLLFTFVPQLYVMHDVALDYTVLDSVITYFRDKVQQLDDYLENGWEDEEYDQHDYDFWASTRRQQCQKLMDALKHLEAIC